jgi:hypothetical protein
MEALGERSTEWYNRSMQYGVYLVYQGPDEIGPSVVVRSYHWLCNAKPVNGTVKLWDVPAGSTILAHGDIRGGPCPNLSPLIYKRHAPSLVQPSNLTWTGNARSP